MYAQIKQNYSNYMKTTIHAILSLTLSVVAMLCAMPVHGQVNLTAMAPLSTDSLMKCSIRYFSPGKGGRDMVWDFSDKLRSKESSQVMFMTDSIGVLSIVEPGRTSHYRPTGDTLMLSGRESALEKRDYVDGKVSGRFPLAYNDSLAKAFRCEGMYCGDHPFREVGTTVVKVDGSGSIVLAEGDTLRDVMRVHSVDSYSICMAPDTAALDTARLTQVIDERHEWYLPQSQYPIIEDVTSTTYYNMDVVGTTRRAWCNLPEDQAARYVTPDDSDGTDDQEGFPDEDLPTPDIIHYSVETQGKTVVIRYDLDQPHGIPLPEPAMDRRGRAGLYGATGLQRPASGRVHSLHQRQREGLQRESDAMKNVENAIKESGIAPDDRYEERIQKNYRVIW